MKLGCAFVKPLDDASSDSRILQPQGARISTVERRVSPSEFFACGDCAPHASFAIQSGWQ
jgi:hypothetical protein